MTDIFQMQSGPLLGKVPQDHSDNGKICCVCLFVVCYSLYCPFIYSSPFFIVILFNTFTS